VCSPMPAKTCAGADANANAGVSPTDATLVPMMPCGCKWCSVECGCECSAVCMWCKVQVQCGSPYGKPKPVQLQFAPPCTLTRGDGAPRDRTLTSHSNLPLIEETDHVLIWRETHDQHPQLMFDWGVGEGCHLVSCLDYPEITQT